MCVCVHMCVWCGVVLLLLAALALETRRMYIRMTVSVMCAKCAAAHARPFVLQHKSPVAISLGSRLAGFCAAAQKASDHYIGLGSSLGGVCAAQHVIDDIQSN